MFYKHLTGSRIVHLNLRAGSTFPVPVCTVSPGLWVSKAVRLYASYRLNLLLSKGQVRDLLIKILYIYIYCISGYNPTALLQDGRYILLI